VVKGFLFLWRLRVQRHCACLTGQTCGGASYDRFSLSLLSAHHRNVIPTKTYPFNEKAWKLEFLVPANATRYGRCSVLALKFHDAVGTTAKAVIKIKA